MHESRLIAERLKLLWLSRDIQKVIGGHVGSRDITSNLATEAVHHRRGSARQNNMPSCRARSTGLALTLWRQPRR